MREALILTFLHNISILFCNYMNEISFSRSEPRIPYNSDVFVTYPVNLLKPHNIITQYPQHSCGIMLSVYSKESKLTCSWLCAAGLYISFCFIPLITCQIQQKFSSHIVKVENIIIMPFKIGYPFSIVNQHATNQTFYIIKGTHRRIFQHNLIAYALIILFQQ